MSGSKRAKIQFDRSSLPNNIQGILISNSPFTSRLEYRISAICTSARYCGILQATQLEKELKKASDDVRFVLVEFPVHSCIYAIAHPTVCTENDLTAILKTLVESFEGEINKFDIKYPDVSKNVENERPFWEKTLENVRLDVDLSTHFDETCDTGTGKVDFRIDNDVRHFCEQFRIDSAILFFGITQLFLSKHTQQKIFSIRTLILPYFDNTLCIPCNVNNENITLIDLLRKINVEIDKYSTFSHVPFHLISSQILKNKQNNVSFTFYPKLNVNSNKIDITWHPYEHSDTFGLIFRQNDDNFDVTFTYDKRFFTADKMSLMADRFRLLLDECLKNVDKNVIKHSLLTQTDTNLYNKWNETRLNFDSNLTITKMIQNQTGDNVAIKYDDIDVTYSQLNNRSKALSTYLRDIGGKHRSIVGICMDKTVDLIATYIATLKIGASYVPIDPNFPMERIKYLIQDSKLQFIITTDNLKRNLPQICPIYSLPTNVGSDIGSENQACANENLVATLVATSAAYIVYTSGTTGKPKGVVTSHRNVIAQIIGISKILESIDFNGVLISASPTFCLFHVLLYFALAYGKSVVLAPSLLHLPELKCKDEIELIANPPAGFRRLIRDGNLPKALKIAIFGGDVVPRDLIRDLYENRDIRIYTSHGCTESTLFDLCGFVDKCLRHKLSSGRPVPNVKIYILNDMDLVPIGFIGELCISGPQVVNGYLNSVPENNVKFVDNPFNVEKDEFYVKMFRTGDLGYWTQDGTVVITGRTNEIVKINGIRIGLNEIACEMNENESVSESVVNVYDFNGISYLVAYFVPKTDVDVESIKRYLKTRLPSYSVPQFYVKIDKLPRNVNGKVDRKSLPPPSLSAGNFQTNYVTPTQTMVLSCIHKLLPRPVGLLDNLFENGLDSVSATQLVINLNKSFDIKIPASVIYDCACAGDLSAIIEDILSGKSMTSVKIDLLNEAHLSDDVIDESARSFDINRATDPKHVLLTGATGFVGAFILNELLDTTNAHIYCLVRAGGPDEARERLIKNLKFYGIWKQEKIDRISPVVGDVTKPNLGLEKTEYETLTSQIETIYHSAANVNFVLPYSAMKNDVIEILKFALKFKTKPLHYVSSIAVHGTRKSGISDAKMYENNDLNENINLIPNNGYAQMKWVTEKMVQTAHARGLPVTIFRPSFVGSDSQSGGVSTREFFTRFIKDCIEMKYYPSVDTPFQLIPVDYVSKSIVKISLNTDNFGKTFHLTPTLDDVTARGMMGAAVEYGFKMEEINLNIWLEKLAYDSTKTLYPLFDFVKDYLGLKRDNLWDYDDSNVKNALKNVKNKPETNLTKLLDFLIKCNYICIK